MIFRIIKVEIDWSLTETLVILEIAKTGTTMNGTVNYLFLNFIDLFVFCESSSSTIFVMSCSVNEANLEVIVMYSLFVC